MPNEAKILTREQAQAAYESLCALKKVGALMDAQFPAKHGYKLRVLETVQGAIKVEMTGNFAINDRTESYYNLDMFAVEYGLDQG